jgi:hypothetical protein
MTTLVQDGVLKTLGGLTDFRQVKVRRDQVVSTLLRRRDRAGHLSRSTPTASA